MIFIGSLSAKCIYDFWVSVTLETFFEIKGNDRTLRMLMALPSQKLTRLADQILAKKLDIPPSGLQFILGFRPPKHTELDGIVTGPPQQNCKVPE
jgi:hypothetical protein